MPMKVKIVDWTEVERWSSSLSRSIVESGYAPDAIIAVARGGLVPARLLADMLSVKDVLSIRIEHWNETAKPEEKAVVKEPLRANLSGKKILIVDDIADTGESLMLAKENVSSCNPKEAKTAAFQFIGKTSRFKPDFIAEQLSEWIWYMYPWNYHEDVKNLVGRIKKPGDTEASIMEKFIAEYGTRIPIDFKL